MTLSPVLHEFFFSEAEPTRRIVVKCTTQEQKNELIKLAEMVFNKPVCSVFMNEEYIIWRQHIDWNGIEDGFDSFSIPLLTFKKEYLFDEFMKEAFIIEDEDVDLKGIGDLL